MSCIQEGNISFRWIFPFFFQRRSIGLCVLIGIGFCFSPLEAAPLSKKDLPSFLSIKNVPCNVRVGPGKHFPIEWVFQMKGMPVQILSKYHEWYKIKDAESSTGWIHKSMLSYKPQVLFRSSEAKVYSKPSLQKGSIVAVIKAGVLARLKKCEHGWCDVIIEGHNGSCQKGYVEAHHIWGTP